MANYPPSSVDLLILGFTHPEARMEGHRAATVTYRPGGPILPFWWFFMLAGVAAIAGILIWTDAEAEEWIYPGLALAGSLILLAFNHMLPWRGTARFARGSVTLTRETGLGRPAEQWSEPLTAYRGLRAWRENWDEESQPAFSPISSTAGAGSQRRMRIAQARTWAFLEHATNPARSLPILRHDGVGDRTPEIEDLARHLSLTVLDEVRRGRFGMSTRS